MEIECLIALSMSPGVGRTPSLKPKFKGSNENVRGLKF